MKRIVKSAVFGLAAMVSGVAAAEGDPAYGEYLSGECVTCHRLDGEMEGIPAIIGWDDDLFIEAMRAYQSGARKNEAMANVAKPLGDEELQALAAYFRQLDE